MIQLFSSDPSMVYLKSRIHSIFPGFKVKSNIPTLKYLWHMEQVVPQYWQNLCYFSFNLLNSNCLTRIHVLRVCTGTTLHKSSGSIIIFWTKKRHHKTTNSNATIPQMMLIIHQLGIFIENWCRNNIKLGITAM